MFQSKNKWEFFHMINSFRTCIILCLCLTCFTSTFANNNHPKDTSSTIRKKSYLKRKKQLKNSYVKNIPFKNIGPTIMSGRVVDIEVNPKNPRHFYVAYASGGLWETNNEGMSFKPIFDNQMVISIGDIAVDWNQNIIYVGTGEANSSRSSYSGFGLYKSTNNGKSWQHMGLEESHHISRILISPKNPNIIYVAVLGHLYSLNKQRGLYKSINGGKTWKKSLYISPKTGIVDVVMHPQKPNTLIAASWEKDRKAWNFKESGGQSNLYKTDNGGKEWKKISTPSSGLPVGKGLGRIGLSYAANGELFAVIDNQNRRSPKKEIAAHLTKKQLEKMDRKKFLKLDENVLNIYLDEQNFPKKYTAKSLKEEIKKNSFSIQDIVDYNQTANDKLFDTPVIGAEVYHSQNAGKSWKKTHDNYLDNFVYSYGYYFGQIRVDPNNKKQIYILGVPLLFSKDGGSTWKKLDQKNVHADHHALWINPKKPGHLISGNDGGINITYDNGKHWDKRNSIPVGQYYSVNVDMKKPYNIFGGFQDNGVWYGPNNYTFSNLWHQSGIYPHQRIMGGDGMQIAIDTRDNNTIYTGFQFGNYFRLNLQEKKRSYITPKHDIGESHYRWNWETPIHLSIHNQDILYMGSHVFHRSLDQGKTFEHKSKDLTLGAKPGNVSYGTLTSIHESPLTFGLIYVGSDDGLVHISKDLGNTWTTISDSLPKQFWVSQVWASQHQKSTVYISLNGYRWDNFEALVYRSDNYGKTWKKIGSNLPFEPVNVIKDDPVNKNIIYVGTDHGAYVSLNRGESFMAFDKGLVNAPVHDLVVHPRENDLILATHGRSLFKANIKHLQELNTSILQKDLHVFPINEIQHNKNWGKFKDHRQESQKPSIQIVYFSKHAQKINLTVSDNEQSIYEAQLEAIKGLNYHTYHGTYESLDGTCIQSDDKTCYITPNTYKIRIKSTKASSEAALVVKAKKSKRNSS